MMRYERSGLQHRIARAQLLAQISGADRDVKLADLLTFARSIGDASGADSVGSFRAAQLEELATAQAELARLAATDQPTQKKR